MKLTMDRAEADAVGCLDFTKYENGWHTSPVIDWASSPENLHVRYTY